MPPATIPNPFTRQDYDLIQHGLRQIHDLLPLLDKAEACGIDVAPTRELLSHFQGRLQSIVQHFLTPPPTV